MLEIFTALTAGLLSFFSPCIFPLIPVYLSLISGVNVADTNGEKINVSRVKTAGILFVLGFSVAFTLLGASSTLIGKFLFQNKRILTFVCGIIIIIFSLHLTGIVNLKFLNYEKKTSFKKFSFGILTPPVMGFAFALGWMPCIGPVLAGILALAATKETLYKGILLMLFYSAGLGIPFIIAAFAAGRVAAVLNKYKNFVKYSRYIAAGILFIVGFILIFHLQLPYFKI